jgi:nucleotidyltransferase substrate binding protein (TIGR01987 family)
MTEPRERPRWLYRFDNFSRAFALLREAIEGMEEREPSQLEQEGIVQRFEYTWELAWKTLKDFLDDQGISLNPATPKAVIRAAFKADIISRGDDWMAALDARNKMSHTYNFEVFKQVVSDIRAQYLGLFDSLHDYLVHHILQADEPEPSG